MSRQANRTNAKKAGNGIIQFPDELLVNIFLYMRKIDAHIIAFVCQRWRKVIGDKLVAAQIRQNEVLDGYGHTLRTRPTTVAAANGNLRYLQWLTQNIKVKFSWCEVEVAAENGHLLTLRWLVENGCKPDLFTMDAAKRGGHLEVIQWLQLIGCRCVSGGYHDDL